MLFVDVDAMAKLAHWNLLEHLPTLLTLDWQQVVTVESLAPRARKAAKGNPDRLFSEVFAAANIVEVLPHVGRFDQSCDREILKILTNLTAMDVGEALLLAMTVAHPQGVFLTGDKRAIQALAQSPVANLFAGRVVIMEQVILHALSVLGRDKLLQHICPFLQCDRTISICLGSNCDNQAVEIRMALMSYISEIDRLVIPTLLCEKMPWLDPQIA